MAAKTPFLVTIVDEAGAALAVDQVTFDAPGGIKILLEPPFAFDLLAAGDGKLTVEKANHHTYEFALKITATGDDFTVRFADTMIDVPQMASLAKVTAGTAAKTSSKNLLKLTIGKAREIVLVGGYDYRSGSIYRDHVICRMHDLNVAGAIDDSTVISIFDMQSGEETRWVRGRSEEKVSNKFAIDAGWSVISVVTHPTPDLDRNKATYPGAGTMGIVEVYRYIESIGQLRPGTLEELSFFSHSFLKGPILFDTNEHPPFKAGQSQGGQRDPADRDGRFWKDFNEINMPNRAQFVAAFSANALVKIWGCQAWQPFRDALHKARDAASDTATLGVPQGQREVWNHPGTFHPDTRPGIHDLFKQSIYRANYPYELSQVIGKPVWGSPGGIGSQDLPTAFGRRSYVAEFQLSIRNGQIVQGPPFAKQDLDYMKANFGWIFDAGNYLKYQ